MKIDAFSNGKEIRLKEGKAISISFPKDALEEKGMNLYFGVENENGVVVWEEANSLSGAREITEQPAEMPADILYTEDPNYYYSDSKNYRPEKGDSIFTFISPWHHHRNELIKEENYYTHYHELDEALEKILILTKREKIRSLGSSIRVHYILFEDGDFEVIKIEGNISKNRKEQLSVRLNQMQKIKPFFREGEPAEIHGIVNSTSFVFKSFPVKIPSWYMRSAVTFPTP